MLESHVRREHYLKVTIQKDPNIKETEIVVHCSEVSVRLQKLIDHIHQYSFVFEAKTQSGMCMVPAEEIYYIDSTDGKTFLYTKEKVYDYSKSLSEIESIVPNSSFVRISKNCILNITYLESVNPFWNHRLEAILTNGEKLMVTRHYIKSLKEKILGWEES